MSTIFVLGLIRGDINSETVLSQLRFNVPVRPTYKFETFNECYQVIDFSQSKSIKKPDYINKF